MMFSQGLAPLEKKPMVLAFGCHVAFSSSLPQVSNLYSPVAVACSRIYFTLEQLSDLQPSYQFSLPFFFRIVTAILQPAAANAAPGSDMCPEGRVRSLLRGHGTPVDIEGDLKIAIYHMVHNSFATFPQNSPQI
jgi:hypothetical protein